MGENNERERGRLKHSRRQVKPRTGIHNAVKNDSLPVATLFILMVVNNWYIIMVSHCIQIPRISMFILLHVFLGGVCIGNSTPLAHKDIFHMLLHCHTGINIMH